LRAFKNKAPAVGPIEGKLNSQQHGHAFCVATASTGIEVADIDAWIFESSPDCVKVMDLDGKLLRMNHNGQSLLEVDQFGELAGVAWTRLWPTDSQGIVEAAIAEARRGQVSRFHAACPTVTGKQKWWDNTISPIRRGGVITHLLAVSRDVTELVERREQAEEARRVAEAADRTKAAFAFSISHEARTPLNAILGLTQSLLMNEMDTHKLQLLAAVESAGQRLVGLIDDMVDLSESEAGQLVLADRDLRIEDVLERVKRGAEHIAPNRSVRIVLEDGVKFPQLLSGDSARLFRVLLNGVSIALRRARDEVRIHVQVESRTSEVAQLRFEIKDNGSALTPKEIDRLSGCFTDAHAESAKNGGTGLGLAICKHLVGAMGGESGFRSEAEVGSTFWFTALFRVRSSDLPMAFRPPVQLVGKRVLVVDDDALNREVARSLLEIAGVIVETACDGKEAVETVQRSSVFDAVLMDMLMPVMDGLDATRALRAMGGSGLLPVIAMTANARASDREAFLAAGADYFMSKPIDAAKLWNVLAHWTRHPHANACGAR
jgi:PAS domain S-box-containing protein